MKGLIDPEEEFGYSARDDLAIKIYIFPLRGCHKLYPWRKAEHFSMTVPFLGIFHREPAKSYL